MSTLAAEHPQPRTCTSHPHSLLAGWTNTVAAAMAVGSALAANMERGSVPSSTLLSGSTTELDEEDELEEVLPFRLTFFVFDSVTCGRQESRCEEKLQRWARAVAQHVELSHAAPASRGKALV